MREYYRPNFFANTPDILPPYLQTRRPAGIRRPRWCWPRRCRASTASIAASSCAKTRRSEPDAKNTRIRKSTRSACATGPRPAISSTRSRASIASAARIRALHDWRNVRFYRADDDAVIFYGKRHRRQRHLRGGQSRSVRRCTRRRCGFRPANWAWPTTTPYEIEELLYGSGPSQSAWLAAWRPSRSAA